jgi:hypothetical protein
MSATVAPFRPDPWGIVPSYSYPSEHQTAHYSTAHYPWNNAPSQYHGPHYSSAAVEPNTASYAGYYNNPTHHPNPGPNYAPMNHGPVSSHGLPNSPAAPVRTPNPYGAIQRPTHPPAPAYSAAPQPPPQPAVAYYPTVQHAPPPAAVISHPPMAQPAHATHAAPNNNSPNTEELVRRLMNPRGGPRDRPSRVLIDLPFVVQTLGQDYFADNREHNRLVLRKDTDIYRRGVGLGLPQQYMDWLVGEDRHWRKNVLILPRAMLGPEQRAILAQRGRHVPNPPGSRRGRGH